MRDIDDLKAIALEYGKRQAPSILTKGEGDEAMSIIDAAFDLGYRSSKTRPCSDCSVGWISVRKSLNPCIAQWQWYWLGFSGSGGMSPIVMMGKCPRVKRLLACPAITPLDLAQLVVGFTRVG